MLKEKIGVVGREVHRAEIKAGLVTKIKSWRAMLRQSAAQELGIKVTSGNGASRDLRMS
jgi:hypothetical protein